MKLPQIRLIIGRFRQRLPWLRTRTPRSPRTASKALGWAVLIFLVFQGTLLFLAHQSPRIRDPLYGDRLHLLQKVKRDKAALNPTLVMMLGSSRTGNAFDALRMEQLLEASGRPHLVFNYGMAGTGPLTELLYLRRLLQAGIKPQLLLVEIYPLFLIDFGSEPFETYWLKPDRFLLDEAAFAESYGIPPDRITASHREVLLNPFGELRWKILSRIQPTWTPAQVGYHWVRQTDPRGWIALFPPTRTEEQRERSTTQTKNEIGGVYCAGEFGGPAIAALRDLQKLCQENGIETRWILMPETSSFRSWYAPDVENRLGALRESLIHDGLTSWIDARLWVPDDQFADGHHLLPAGASTFTQRLTNELFPEIPAKPAH